MKIDGKAALITGGASGFGKALALRLLEKGAKFVAVVDFDKVNGEKVCSEYSEKFGKDRVKFIHCDVTDENQLKNAFQQAYDVNQSLDVVVNNAGIMSDDQRKTIEVNLIAVMNGTLLAHELLTKTKREEKGVIVNTASLAGLAVGPVANISYFASKFGIIGLTKAFPVSTDGFSQDVRAVAVCPSAVDTPLWTSNDFLTEDIAATLETVKDRFVTVPMVTDAFVRAIEDDELNGAILKVEVEGIEID